MCEYLSHGIQHCHHAIDGQDELGQEAAHEREACEGPELYHLASSSGFTIWLHHLALPPSFITKPFFKRPHFELAHDQAMAAIEPQHNYRTTD